jgi:hypothetical protein
MWSVINHLLAEHSGQSIEQIEKDTERDFSMSAQQAKEYGLGRFGIAAVLEPDAFANAEEGGKRETVRYSTVYPGVYFACLPWSRQRATRSDMFASPTHMTVSAAPQ